MDGCIVLLAYSVQEQRLLDKLNAA